MDRRDALLPWKIAAHRALRYARWSVERWTYARDKVDPTGGGTAGWTTIAGHRSRLVRDPARALLEMAAGKAHNLRLACAALDGLVVQPGETLSFWFTVGAPTAERGYRKGMELRSGCIVPSVGGGICQLAGALYELALRAGLTVLEHHPHSLELAPERDRIRPFGTAAAVLYPYRDLRLRNDGDQPLVVCARVGAHELDVSLRAPHPLPFTIDLEERGYASDGRRREGELWQVCRKDDLVLWQRRVVARQVAVMTDMPQSHCYTCDRACPNAVPASDPEARLVRAELRVVR